MCGILRRHALWVTVLMPIPHKFITLPGHQASVLDRAVLYTTDYQDAHAKSSYGAVTKSQLLRRRLRRENRTYGHLCVRSIYKYNSQLKKILVKLKIEFIILK